MTKKEFVERYGMDRWLLSLQRREENIKRKQQGLPPLPRLNAAKPKVKKVKSINVWEYAFKLEVPEDYERCYDTYDAYRKAEFKMQDHIKKKWYRYSRDPYILVIDWTDTRGGYFKFKAELHKNNITLQDRTVLQQICEETKQEFKITPINIDEDEE